MIPFTIIIEPRLLSGLLIWKTEMQEPVKPQQPFPPRWVPDQQRPVCNLCKSAFSLFNRRHHCRRCGEIVCETCSPARAKLVELRGNGANYDPQGGLYGEDVMRICNNCVPLRKQFFENQRKYEEEKKAYDEYTRQREKQEREAVKVSDLPPQKSNLTHSTRDRVKSSNKRPPSRHHIKNKTNIAEEEEAPPQEETADSKGENKIGYKVLDFDPSQAKSNLKKVTPTSQTSGSSSNSSTPTKDSLKKTESTSKPAKETAEQVDYRQGLRKTGRQLTGIKSDPNDKPIQANSKQTSSSNTSANANKTTTPKKAVVTSEEPSTLFTEEPTEESNELFNGTHETSQLSGNNSAAQPGFNASELFDDELEREDGSKVEDDTSVSLHINQDSVIVEEQDYKEPDSHFSDYSDIAKMVDVPEQQSAEQAQEPLPW